MTRTLRVRREAERDVEMAFAWYEERRPGLGGEFLDELDLVFTRIARFPFIHAELYRGLRRARLRRFPVGVFGSRDPCRSCYPPSPQPENLAIEKMTPHA